MARIKRVTVDHYPNKNDGCMCDRCGQWICHVVSVTFTDGVTMHYGLDCFDKLLLTGKLTAYGKKLMKKTVDSIDHWQAVLNKYTSGEMTAETDESWKYTQIKADWCTPSYWYGRPYEEYRKWMIEEVIPYRIETAQKEIDKFSKANFAR